MEAGPPMGRETIVEAGPAMGWEAVGGIRRPEGGAGVAGREVALVAPAASAATASGLARRLVFDPGTPVSRP